MTVTWSGSDSTAGIQGYQYQIDNGGYSGTTSELSQMFSGLSNGAHEVDIKAIDNATRYTVSSVNITVDNVAPVLTIVSPISGSFLGSPSVSASWSANI